MNKASTVVGRVLPLRKNRPFYIPNKFGPQPPKMPVFVGRPRRGAARVINKKPTLPIYRKGQVYPKREPISKPEQIERKITVNTTSKNRKKVFILHSPEEIQLKAERTKFMQEI